MTTPGGGLARIIMLAPKRRVEVAVPEHVPLVGLMPTLLRHGGQSLAEDGVEHGGWVLRRLDGRPLATNRSLAALGVADGETLVLAARDQEWPEPSFDDVAEVVAATAQRLGARWGPAASRLTGRLTAASILLVGVFLVAGTPADGALAGGAAYGAAAALLVAAGLLARSMADPPTAGLLAAFGAGYAVLGGLLVPAVAPLTAGVTAWQVVSAAASLVFAGALGRIALTGYAPPCIAAVVLATGCGLTALLYATGVASDAGAAAIVAGLLALTVFLLPRLAMYQGGVPAPPMPSLAGAAEDPPPPTPELADSVRRSDDLLTGLLHGCAGTLVACQWVLAVRSSTGAVLLLAAVVLLCALRSRAFGAVRHRAPLLVAVAAGAAALAWRGWQGLAPDGRTAALVPLLGALLILVGLAVAAGTHYARRAPSPHLGRAGDLADTVLAVAVPILVALVLGLFGAMRALLGG